MEPRLSLASSQRELRQAQAFVLLIVYCLIYVLPLHASAATRAAAGRSRDAPAAIRARIRSVSVSTALCSLTTFILLHWIAAADQVSPWHIMGYWPLGLVDASKSLLLTSLLYAGPLYEYLFIDGACESWLRLQPLKQLWGDWAVWRNMVAGPVTEECLFRSAAVPLLLAAGCSTKSIIFLSPLVFGLAHLHHFYEFRVTHPETPIIAAIARSTLQLSYTSIFGAYATFLFLRTGSLLSVILVHTLCNGMGLPRVWGVLEPYWLPDHELSQPGTTLKWTVPYYLLLLGGSILWWQNLSSLTASSMALAQL